MNEFTSHKPGTFCWLDLSTTALEVSKNFYCELFGWKSKEVSIDGNVVYTLMTLNGKSVAGVNEMNPQQREQGQPPCWLSYVATENIEEAIEKATENGGIIAMPAMDVMDEGRMAIIIDPEGAMVGVWQAKSHIGTSYKNMHGTLCWNEHSSHDTTHSIPFLEKTFGWTAKHQEMGGMQYTTFYLGEEAIGGLYKMSSDVGQIPSHWLPYFAVDNIEKSTETAKKLKAEVLMPTTYIKGVGHFAVLRDPQGAVFGVIQGEEK